MQSKNITITDGQIIVGEGSEQQQVDLYSAAGFEVLSQLWLQVGWHLRYSYTFTWMGRPVIQLPEDMLRIQEVIFKLKPDVIIETGVAHGGSLIFYASLCKTLEKGRVVGVDIEIRPHNRAAIEEHFLAPFITLIEGSSTDPAIVESVRAHIKPGDTVLILLDSNHTRGHVLAELEAYSSMVTLNSYIVATDGVMEQVVGAPRTNPEWTWDNPRQAALQFAAEHPEFVIEEPALLFNEGDVHQITYWPDAYLKRVR